MENKNYVYLFVNVALEEETIVTGYLTPEEIGEYLKEEAMILLSVEPLEKLAEEMGYKVGF